MSTTTAPRPDAGDKNDLSTGKVWAAATLYLAQRITREYFFEFVLAWLAGSREIVTQATILYMSKNYGVAVELGTPDFSQRDRASLEKLLDRYGEDKLTRRAQEFAGNTIDQYERNAIIDAGREAGAAHWKWITPKSGGHICQECRSKNGALFPIDIGFWDHPNCNCYPRLIFKENDNA